MEKQLKIGIAGYGLYMPHAFETSEEIAERSGLTAGEIIGLGIHKKCVPSKDDQPVTMAVKAAKKALEQAEDVKPGDVDVVIWTGEEYKDYIAQTAAIRLQEEVGCHEAWAFDLVGQGVTSIQGLRIAQDIIGGDATVNTILLAGGTRNGDLVDYKNADTRFLLACSASGGALLIKRNHEKNSIIDTAFTVDPHMADEVFVPGGGTETPFSPDNLDSDIMFYQAAHPPILKEYLESRWNRALSETAGKIMPERGADYVALRHLVPTDRIAVLKALRVKPDQSVPLDEWGHHGTNDVILSLDLGIKKGLVTNGSSVLMVSGGIGFHYAAALISWGDI